MEAKSRKEMNPEYMWDLKPIYENDDAWRAALKDAEAGVASLSDIPGTLGQSAAALRAGLDRINAVSETAASVMLLHFIQVFIIRQIP